MCAEMTEEKKRIRNFKTNLKQKKVMLQFLAENPYVFYHKITADFTIDNHNAFWREITEVLNVFGPPRKTSDAWKKTWKDMRCRYRRTGVDLRQIVQTLRSDMVVDTKALLPNSDKLSASKGINEDSFLSIRGGLNSSPCATPPDVSPLRDPEPGTMFKYNIGKTIEAARELGLGALESRLQFEAKRRKLTRNQDTSVRDSHEVLLSVVEVVGTDYENEDYESERALSPVMNERLSKRQRRDNTPDRTAFDSSPETTRRPNGMKKNGINDVVAELRHMNKMQKEKNTMQKNFIAYQKVVMEQTLDMQRDMVKTQKLLANSVKAFVDNIAFNS